MVLFTVDPSPELSLMKATNQPLTLQEGGEEREREDGGMKGKKHSGAEARVDPGPSGSVESFLSVAQTSSRLMNSHV